MPALLHITCKSNRGNNLKGKKLYACLAPMPFADNPRDKGALCLPHITKMNRMNQIEQLVLYRAKRLRYNPHTHMGP